MALRAHDVPAQQQSRDVTRLLMHVRAAGDQKELLRRLWLLVFARFGKEQLGNQFVPRPIVGNRQPDVFLPLGIRNRGVGSPLQKHGGQKLLHPPRVIVAGKQPVD